MIATSTPTISSFDPDIIPYQRTIIEDIRNGFDYSLGTHEVMMSGSIGSAKSTVMAHIALTHCLLNVGARFLLGRLSMPALRATLFNKILEHIGDDLKEGRDYWLNQTTATVKFRNGSEIICRSWSDKKYFKVRSLELSGAAIEEIIENETQDFYNEIKMRVGRLPHIKENIIINATNPGSPESWQYKYFIESQPSQTRHIYYSLTDQNPFLPKQYTEQLRRDLDPKLAQRMLYGQWIEINKEVIYYQYNPETQYLKETEYTPNENHPIWLSWDFNIGQGKPMSVIAIQYIDGIFHVFKEWVIDGMRTSDSVEEIEASGILEIPTDFIVTGDAAGKNRDTRSKGSDYDIIMKYLSNVETKKGALSVERYVLPSNPPIRKRHNLVNAHCLNANDEVRLFLYKGVKTLDEGLRLTSLKKNGNYIEDDSKHFQHVTTALGYMMNCAVIKDSNNSRIRIKQL